MFGLLGGTFDPVHLGHLHLAVAIADRYRYSEIGFFPARQNPLKTEIPGATAWQRLDMLKLALADLSDPRFRLFDWEVQNAAPSYTLATVERCLQNGYRDIGLIVGNEVFASFARWHEPKQLLEKCNVIVATRGNVDLAAIGAILATVGVPASRQGRRLVHSGGRWIEIAAIDPLPYSATALRAAWARYWRQPNHLPQGTTASVTAFIKRNRLYAVTR